MATATCRRVAPPHRASSHDAVPDIADLGTARGGFCCMSATSSRQALPWLPQNAGIAPVWVWPLDTRTVRLFLHLASARSKAAAPA